MTQEEQDAWDEHERYLAYRDRKEYLKDHGLNVAICNAIATLPPWED